MKMFTGSVRVLLTSASLKLKLKLHFKKKIIKIKLKIKLIHLIGIFAKTLTNLLRDLFAKSFKSSSQCWQIFHFEMLINFDDSF